MLPLENPTLASYRLIILMCGMALSLLHDIDIVQTLTGYTHIAYFNKCLSQGTSYQPLCKCMLKTSSFDLSTGLSISFSKQHVDGWSDLVHLRWIHTSFKNSAALILPASRPLVFTRSAIGLLSASLYLPSPQFRVVKIRYIIKTIQTHYAPTSS